MKCMCMFDTRSFICVSKMIHAVLTTCIKNYTHCWACQSTNNSKEIIDKDAILKHLLYYCLCRKLSSVPDFDLQFSHIKDRWSQIGCSMGEGAVSSILRAQSPGVRVVYTHARFVIAEVVAPLSVPSSAVQIWTPENKWTRLNYLTAILYRAI